VTLLLKKLELLVDILKIQPRDKYYKRLEKA